MSRIPKRNADLCRYVWRRVILRLMGFALWLAMFYAGARSYNQNHRTYSESRLIVGWKIWVWMLIGAVTGILLFRLWRFFTQRPARGRVERYATSRTATGGPGGAENDTDFHLNTVLRVRTRKGRIRRLRFEQKNGFYVYYHEGEYIVKLGGLPYPINLEPSESGYVCAVCGNFARSPSETCPTCRRTIIDPEDLK